jgi:hypothetical protein
VDAGPSAVRSLPRLMLQRFGAARHYPAVIGTTACCVLFVALVSPAAVTKAALANLQDLSAESATAEERPALQSCSDLELWLLDPTQSAGNTRLERVSSIRTISRRRLENGGSNDRHLLYFTG